MSERNCRSNTKSSSIRRNTHKRCRGPNPRRGGPGVLLTCERGREVKCQREGLDILRYYLAADQSKKEEGVTETQSLTLEEEISMLQSGASVENVLGDNGGVAAVTMQSKSQPFGVYETGCGGTVVIMCTLPFSALIPPIRTKWSGSSDRKREASSEEVDSAHCNTVTKRARLEEKGVPAEGKRNHSAGGKDTCQQLESKQEAGSEAQATSKGTPPWDPVGTCRRVLGDLESASTSAPSSRFVIRMIPMQATCFASIEEIGLTSKALVNKYLKGKTPSTFAVTVKRRNCSTLTREQIIDAVAGEILGTNGANEAWKVDLKSPEYTVMVEICQTLCGVAIVQNCAAYRNFNLLEIREAQQVTTDK